MTVTKGSMCAVLAALFLAATPALAQSHHSDASTGDEVEAAESRPTLALARACFAAVQTRLSADEQQRVLVGALAPSAFEQARWSRAELSVELRALAKFALRVARAVAAASGDPRASETVLRLRDIVDEESAQTAATALDGLAQTLVAEAEESEEGYAAALRGASTVFESAAYLIGLAADAQLAARDEELESEVSGTLTDLFENALAAGADRRIVTVMHGAELLRELHGSIGARAQNVR